MRLCVPHVPFFFFYYNRHVQKKGGRVAQHRYGFVDLDICPVDTQIVNSRLSKMELHCSYQIGGKDGEFSSKDNPLP